MKRKAEIKIPEGTPPHIAAEIRASQEMLIKMGKDKTFKVGEMRRGLTRFYVRTKGGIEVWPIENLHIYENRNKK